MVKNNVSKVAENSQCTGCGACVGMCPTDAISMKWDTYQDYVAEVDNSKCINCELCVKICPGKEVDFASLNAGCKLQKKDQFQLGVGSSEYIAILNSTDDKAFSEGTSGAVVREILACLIEENEIDAVLHITDNEKPLTFPFFAPSTIMDNPDEIRYHKVHSRYCPAPLLTALKMLKEDNLRYAVVTLPCHTHALRKLQNISPKWKDKIKYIVGLLCSGTPTGAANRFLFEDNGVDVSKLVSLDYRYGKWPKGVVGFQQDGTQHLVRKMGGLKEQSRIFQMIGVAYMSPFFWRRRCMFCADFFNLYADICCADPWVKAYWKQSIKDGVPGGTLTIVRNKKMNQFLQKLIERKKINIRMELDEKAPEETMGKFQSERISLFQGFEAVMPSLGLAFPTYKNANLGRLRKRKTNARYRLWKSNLAREKKYWKYFKYISLMEEVYAFALRKMKLR